MSIYFERVTIIGVGLLGASLGLALKARGLAAHVVGVGRRQVSLDEAVRAGAVDETSFDAADAARGASLVVIATPAALVCPKLDEVRPALEPDVLVTDVASTKQMICAHAARLWPRNRRFVGSHPMAGSEKFGPQHGRPGFYEDSVCLVEDSPDIEPAAREHVTALWRAVGARVTPIEPARHDALLARTSHIPHVAASALAAVAAARGDVREMIGNGFRDATRIAASRPEVWRDICTTNREAILDGLAEFRGSLDVFARALEQGDGEAVQAFFEAGNRGRRRVVDDA